MAVIRSHVDFLHPGKYHVWLPSISSGTEDNGFHLSRDGSMVGF